LLIIKKGEYMKKEISLLIALTCIYTLYAGKPKEKNKKNIPTQTLQASKKATKEKPVSPRIEALKRENSPRSVNDADRHPQKAH